MEHGTILRTTAAVTLALCVAGSAAQASETATNWGGAYGGLSFSSVSGHALNSRYISDFGSTSGFGGFAGYNWQHSGFVFGGEVSYINFDTDYGPPYIRQSTSLELRARAGYAFGNVLTYGFVGGARSILTSGGTDDREDGYVFGFGAEAMVANNISVGLEVARRTVHMSGLSLGARIDTVSMRVGYHF